MQRIQSLDLARGFTVLFIPAIHTVMVYSDPAVYTSWLGYPLRVIAEGPGGQLLMLLMGLSFTLKARHSTRSVLLKSGALLAAGYLLNILKFVAPYSMGVLPNEVLQELAVTGEDTAIWQLAGMGDILHFAGLSLPVLHGLYRCKRFHRWAFIGALIVMVISPMVWDIHCDQPALDYILGLATGQPPRVFFPLFPWLVYPLAGLYVGYYFRQNQRDTTLLCGIAGTLLLIAGLIASYYFPVENPAGFYRTPVAATTWHLGIVLLVLCLWHLVSTYIKANRFFQLLTYSSKNITLIYIIQWVMICWMIPVFGFRKLDVWVSAFILATTTLNIYLLTYSFQLIQQRYASK